MLRFLLAAASLAIPMTAHAADLAADPTPATVVVAFDKDTITPLIVEGEADRETDRAVKANDPVRIASVSKMIMALAALRLVDEGKLDLRADVSDYLGWTLRSPYYPEKRVTLAQIMSHRAGLRDDAGYVIPLGESLQDTLANEAAWYPDAAPGKAPFEYANLGSPVVATVLEAASGERYDRLVERLVFAPLGIKACLNWIGCPQERLASAVTLYRDTGEIARDGKADLPPECTIPVAEGSACTLDDYVPGTNASVFSPQGGIRIGMMDLARIGQALMDHQNTVFLSARARERAFFYLLSGRTKEQEFFCNYGLHMQAIEETDAPCEDTLFDDGKVRIGHAGEAYGLRSGLWIDSEGESGIAYFTTAVPDRTSEDEGGFDAREIALMKRAGKLLGKMDRD